MLKSMRDKNKGPCRTKIIKRVITSSKLSWKVNAEVMI